MKQFALLIYLYTNVFKEAMLSSIDVCLSSSVDSNQMTFVCKTDDLHLPVYFYDNHNEEIAHCTIPYPFPKCTTVEREDALVTVVQFPKKNETILFIEESTDHRSNGYWSCEHGKNLYRANVEINIKKAKADCDVNTFTIIMWNVIIFVAVAICTSSCVFSKIPDKIRKWIFNIDEQGYEPLKDNIKCATCDAILTCALCAVCILYYCDLCCKHHKEMNSTHIVFQTRQIVVNQMKVNCNTCTKIAERFCKSCRKPFCTSCSKHHNCDKKDNIIIFQAHSEIKTKKPVELEKRLSYFHSASFVSDENPVRVCGITFLEDGTVVVIDGNNSKLIAFKSQQKENFLNEKLANEPNAITTMTENKFAVTFPYEKKIQIYNLNCNTAQKLKELEIDKFDTKSKPFNIAYNKGRFAVEVGEHEYGRIDIYDTIKKTLIKTINCKDALFTGHTIRLALHQNRLFVSAMGKQMVSCIDIIKEEKLWHLFVPSPRAILVREDYSDGEKVLLASKRCNAIYELKTHQDYADVIKVESDISSPCYMAYHKFTDLGVEMVCVVKNNESQKDELAVFKLIDA